MTGYIYTAVWLLFAAYMIYGTVQRYRTPIMFILSGFMVFLAVWEFVNVLTPVDLKAGVYGWVYRGIALVVLVLCLIWYFVLRNRN